MLIDGGVEREGGRDEMEDDFDNKGE